MPESVSAASPLRVGAFGSCVSRDTIAVMQEHGWAAGPYFARQSLISAGYPVGASVDLAVLPSRFAQRCMEQDMQADRRSLLAQMAARADVMLWDLIDERLGVWRFEDGGVMTRTTEALTAGLDEALAATAGAELLEFGSDAHFEAWQAALPAWREDLEAAGLKDRTVLLYAPWALCDTTGEATPSSWGLSAAAANWQSVRYYEAIAEVVEVRTLMLPDDLVVADPHHRWGVAPFHYVKPAYEWVGAEVEASVNQ